MKNKGEKESDSALMNQRRINLSDGRYLIYFTFDSSLSVDSADSIERTPPQTLNQAPEEKNV